jgi:hypothetical protein
MPRSSDTWPLLITAIAKALEEEKTTTQSLRVFECDHSDDGAYSPLAGLQAARTAVLGAARRGMSIPPVLVVGLSRGLSERGRRSDGSDEEVVGLLNWAGAAYLQYGFTRRALQEATARIIDGAAAPLPVYIVTREHVLRATSNVRHWLEGRLRYEGASLLDFSSAARGEIRLVSAYLAPKAPISKQHREMLDRLWDLKPSVATYAPYSDGLTLIRQAMDQFEAAWSSLEVARAEYRLQLEIVDAVLSAKLAVQVCDELQSAMNALKAAIIATRRLDDQIKQCWRRK